MPLDRQVQLRTEPGLLTWPMGLTFVRLLLLPLFLYLLLIDARTPEHSLRWWAVAVFAVMAITDKLDGYLARRLGQSSKLGALLDPIADKLLIASSVILLSIEWVAPSGFQLPIWVVVAVYGKDLVLALGTLRLLQLVGKVTIRPRMLGKVGTVLQCAMVIAILIAPDLQRLSNELAWWLTRGLWTGVAVLAAASCLDYMFEGWRQLMDHRRRGVSPRGDSSPVDTGSVSET